MFAGADVEYSKINNQEKSVEITEAGVTEITPDAGYTGLSKVSVDTSAISGGSGEGGGSTWRYFDVSGVSNISSIEIFCMMLKLDDAIIPYSGLSTLAFATFFEIKDKIKAIGICPFTLVSASGTQVLDDNMITMFGQQYNLTEITESQFYDLNA